MNKKEIKVIFTGGTIQMNKDNVESRVDISNSQDLLISQLENEFDDIKLSFHTFSNVPSPFLDINDMFSLVKLIDYELQKDNIFGVVVSHGTDTLEESAFMSDLYINSEKPVVFTGSMRNLSEVSYDGIRNLMSSILVASSNESKNRGTLIVLNDEINAAFEASKTHTLTLNTFKSLEFGPLGIIDEKNVIYYRISNYKKYNLRPEKIDDNVEIIKASAGTSSLLLNLVVRNNISGIVLEALGRGNIPPSMLDGVTNALKNNIPIFLTSRAPMGRVLGSYGYKGGGENLEKMGVIFAKNLNSQKARILLIMAISSKLDLKSMKLLFE